MARAVEAAAAALADMVIVLGDEAAGVVTTVPAAAYAHARP